MSTNPLSAPHIFDGSLPAFLIRLFVPANWQLDEQALGTSPTFTGFEIIHESHFPRLPYFGACFDFLFTDGSPSCNHWLTGLQQAGIIDEVACLLHAHDAKAHTLPDCKLPRLACNFADPASWLPLLHTIGGVLEGLMTDVNYGSIKKALPRGDARLELVEISAESFSSLKERVTAWLETCTNAPLRSFIWIIRTHYLEQWGELFELLDQQLYSDALEALEAQHGYLNESAPPSISLLLRY